MVDHRRYAGRAAVARCVADDGIGARRLPKWPDWLGADFVTASALGWDFSQAMKGVGSMYDQATEPGPDGEGLFEDLLDGIRDDPEGVQIDLRDELFARLGPELLGVDDEVPAAQDSPAERRSLYVAAVPDEAKMLETLTRFYKDDEKVHHERKGTYEVWWVDETGSLFVESESETDVTIRGLALGAGHLALATEVAALDKIIAPASDLRRLADDAGWSKLLAWTQMLATDRTCLRRWLASARSRLPLYEKARTPPPKKNPPNENRPSPLVCSWGGGFCLARRPGATLSPMARRPLSPSGVRHFRKPALS